MLLGKRREVAIDLGFEKGLTNNGARISYSPQCLGTKYCHQLKTFIQVDIQFTFKELDSIIS